MVSLNFLDSFLKHLNRLENSHIKQVIENLKTDYGFLLKAFNALSYCILIVNEKLDPIYTNEKTKDFFFVDDNEELDNLEHILLYPKLLYVMKNMIKKGEQKDQKQEILIEGFQPKMINLMVNPIGVNNLNEKVFLICFEDITQKVKEQKESQLKKNILSMDHLAAGLAHEIKNPLTSIKLYLDLLKRSSYQIDESSDLFSDISRSIHVIQEEVERLNDITTDFLTTIRPLSLNLQRIQGHDIAQYLLEIFKQELSSKKITFTIKEQENLPLILGDIKYLKVVFFNLMRNAIDSYLKQTGKKSPKIILTIEENAPFIEISVQDFGQGIEQKHIDKIFEPYFSTKKHGSGIGLSMVYKIVSEHQGTLQVKSELHKGTTFTVLLPIYKGSVRKFLSRKKG